MLQSGGLHKQGGVSASRSPRCSAEPPSPLCTSEVGVRADLLLPWGKALRSSLPISAFFPKIITKQSGSGGSRRHCVEVLPKSGKRK